MVHCLELVQRIEDLMEDWDSVLLVWEGKKVWMTVPSVDSVHTC